MNILFAKVGQTVVYTGNLRYTFDDATANWMKKWLQPNAKYTIIEIGQYANRDMYYRFKECGGCFPCESFTKNFRETIKSVYNLK